MLTANWICSYVLNDMLAIHQNGTSTSSRNATRPTTVSARVPGTSVPLAQEIAADERDARHEDGHEEDRDGHAAPPAELMERDLVRVGGEHLRGGPRAAARHHVDDVEVVDREDEAQHERHDHHVREARQRDVAEALPRP